LEKACLKPSTLTWILQDVPSKSQAPLPDGGKKWVEFDPTGLERAAKAVKELDHSSEFAIKNYHPHSTQHIPST
jgi:hypothetical protein